MTVSAPDEEAVAALADHHIIHTSTARAALLLDAVAPGWDDNVNLDTFDISSTQRCVLGQQVNVHPYFSGLPLCDCSCKSCASDFGRAIDKLAAAIGPNVYIPDLYNFSRSGHEWRALILDRCASVA